MLGLLATALTATALAGQVRSALAQSDLPDRLGLGVYLPIEQIEPGGWMPSTKIPWDYAMVGLSGGVNTDEDWKTYEPDARAPLSWAQTIDNAGEIPVISYYQITDSHGPCDSCEVNEKVLANLASVETMTAWYDDFATLLRRLGPGTSDGVRGFGKTAIVLLEASLAGFAQQATTNPNLCFGHCSDVGDDPSLLEVAVASTGRAELAGLENTYRGFARAITKLRDEYAPNVKLAYAATTWVENDIAIDSDPNVDAKAIGQRSGAFAAAATSNASSPFDLIAVQTIYGDAGWHKYGEQGDDFYWDRTNRSYPNVRRFIDFLEGLRNGSGLPVMVFDVPLGNQVYRTMDNTPGHYQDNKAEALFANLGGLRDAGVSVLLFGSDEPSTQPFDARDDGVTNPASVCTDDGGSGEEICPSRMATVADDDGGFLREKAAAFYDNPTVAGLPTTVGRGPSSFPIVPVAVATLAAIGGTGTILIRRRRRGGFGRAPTKPSERYEIRRLLGEGASKSVHLARDNVLERDVALAILKVGDVSEVLLERLRREARALARLEHPNIVAVYDSGERDERPFIVSQFMPGGSVQELLDTRRGPLPLSQSLAIAFDVARALDHAHSHGIVHRDVKPANVLLSSDGSAKLGDFGLAAAGDVSRLTLPGTVIGTASSMSPEQARGEPATPSTDLYGLGAFLYEMVTGSPPFTGESVAALLSQQLYSEPRPPSEMSPNLPEPLEQLILSMLSKTPEGRPPSAAAVTDTLRTMIATATPAPSSSIELVAASVVAEKPDMRSVVAADGTVTLCFTDIERSTELTEHLGDQAWIEVLRRHNRVVREELVAYQGKEVSSLGDGFLLAFADAGHSLQCATSIQRALAHVFSDPEQPTVRVRIGIHTGEAISEEANFYGRHVNLAARIGAQAAGAEVLVSSATRDRIGDEGFTFGAPRELRLKGLSGSHVVYPLEWRDALTAPHS